VHVVAGLTAASVNRAKHSRKPSSIPPIAHQKHTFATNPSTTNPTAYHSFFI
jgi:hypothetical protein